MSATFCQALPKVELHAHIGGSVSSATLAKLATMHDTTVDLSSANVGDGESRTIKQIFNLFKVVHSVSKTPAALREMTRDVIGDFADDGVKYLELRTTPRHDPTTGMTKLSYLEAVLETICACNEVASEGERLFTCLLVSIDRRGSLESALETVNLALALAPKYRSRLALGCSSGAGAAVGKGAGEGAEVYGDVLVGVDVSGDPSVRCVRDFAPALERARAGGLRLAIHFAEILNTKDDFWIAQELRPDRVGHGTTMDEATARALDASRIPLEICMTSNVKCETVPNFAAHHVGELLRTSHPVVLSTDDKGIFGSALSNEYAIAAREFQLGESELWRLAEQGVGYIFQSEAFREELRRRAWSNAPK